MNIVFKAKHLKLLDMEQAYRTLQIEYLGTGDLKSFIPELLFDKKV